MRAVVGGSQGVSLSVRLSGGEELVKDEEGYQFPSEWMEAIVRTTATTTKGKSVRVFVIKPGGPDVQEIRVGDRFIQGPFTIVNKINNPREANDARKAAARAK